jgi:hypothetical protein
MIKAESNAASLLEATEGVRLFEYCTDASSPIHSRKRKLAPSDYEMAADPHKLSSAVQSRRTALVLAPIARAKELGLHAVSIDHYVEPMTMRIVATRYPCIWSTTNEAGEEVVRITGF